VSTIKTWRLVKSKFVEHAFDGEGARLYGGSWSSPGSAVVYTSATASLAAFEVFAIAQRLDLRASFELLSCAFDDSLVSLIETRDLPMNWRQSPAPARLQQIGDEWLRGADSVVLQVPSTIIEHESNYLLNPRHPDFRRVKRSTPEPFAFDLRLIRKL
jgi:RES domain-containing protein